jgi:hypothetical protein
MILGIQDGMLRLFDRPGPEPPVASGIPAVEAALARYGGVVICSSTIDWPDEATDDKAVIAWCKRFRLGGWVPPHIPEFDRLDWLGNPWKATGLNVTAARAADEYLRAMLPGDALADALATLMHWAAMHGVDFDKAMVQAVATYTRERSGP